MDLKILKAAEKRFIEKYPGGFKNPEIEEIKKKHNVEKLVELSHTMFAEENFNNPPLIAENYSKLLTRSSLVSMFEKPKFRDFSRSLGAADLTSLSVGLHDLLYRKDDKGQKTGFERLLGVLEKGKLAKWSVITVVPAYYHPQKEVFIKPTTTKGIIELLKLQNLEYKPRPSWQFYSEYRKQINELKKHVDQSLSPYNAAFTGFLMMSME